MATINSNMVTNKNMSKIKLSIICITFFQSEIIQIVSLKFADKALVSFVDTLSITLIISSHLIIKLSKTLYKYYKYSHKYMC